MNLATTPLSALQLKRCEVPLELQANFAAIRHTPLFYANYVRKLSHKGKVQSRVLIMTIDHMYLCHPNGDILRCFPYSYVTNVFWDDHREQLGLIIPKEYDVAFQTNEAHQIMHVLTSLRALHQCRTPCSVEHLPQASNSGGGEVDSSNSPAAAPAATTTSGDGNTTSRKKEESSSSSSAKPSRWENFVSEVGKLFSTSIVKKEVPWYSGDPTSHCIGRGYYSLNLARPEGFKLVLSNPNE